MMIKCERHGFYEAIQVSPDLQEQVNAGKKIKEYVVIHYEYDDEIVDSFFLSKEYAAKNNLQNESIHPLPDDYPQWVMSLAGLCEKCFEDSIR